MRASGPVQRVVRRQTRVAESGFSQLLLCDLATSRPVEYTPQGEILGKVLVMMLNSRSHEQKVPCLERVPLAIVNENSSAANDDINLVLYVRRLLVRGHGEGEFYVKGATL